MDDHGHPGTEFRPRRSRGRWSLCITGFLCLVPALIVFVAVPPIRWEHIYILLVTGPLAVFSFAVAASMGGMRYEIREGFLRLSCRPFIHYIIPVDDITSVGIKRLNSSPMAAVRLPGIALFGVRYSNMGTVRMCSTAAEGDVVVVYTVRGNYGVNPERAEEFMAAVRDAGQAHS